MNILQLIKYVIFKQMQSLRINYFRLVYKYVTRFVIVRYIINI